MEPRRPSERHTAPRLADVQQWRQRTREDALHDESERTYTDRDERMFFGLATAHATSLHVAEDRDVVHTLRRAALYEASAGSELYWVGVAPRQTFPELHTQFDVFAERAAGTVLPAHTAAMMRMEVRDYPEGVPWRARTTWVVMRRVA